MQGNGPTEGITCDNAFTALRTYRIAAFHIREQLLREKAAVSVMTLTFRRIFGRAVSRVHIHTYHNGWLQVFIQNAAGNRCGNAPEIKELLAILAIDNR